MLTKVVTATVKPAMMGPPNILQMNIIGNTVKLSLDRIGNVGGLQSVPNTKDISSTISDINSIGRTCRFGGSNRFRSRSRSRIA